MSTTRNFSKIYHPPAVQNGPRDKKKNSTVPDAQTHGAVFCVVTAPASVLSAAPGSSGGNRGFYPRSAIRFDRQSV